MLNNATAFSYGKYLGTRYKNTSVIWILGGDFFATGFEDIWRRMAAGITEGDGGVHLKTYHPKSPRSSAHVVPRREVARFQHAANRAHHFEPQLRPGGRGLGPRSGQARGGWRGRLRRDRRWPGAGAYDYHSRRAPHRLQRDIRRGGGLHLRRRTACGATGVRLAAGPPPAAKKQAAGGDTRHGPAPPWKQALQLPGSGARCSICGR